MAVIGTVLSIRFVPQLGENTTGAINEPIQVADCEWTGKLSIRVLNTESLGPVGQPP